MVYMRIRATPLVPYLYTTVVLLGALSRQRDAQTQATTILQTECRSAALIYARSDQGIYIYIPEHLPPTRLLARLTTG